MKYEPESTFFGRLLAAYPFDGSGYFCDGECAKLTSVSLSARVSMAPHADNDYFTDQGLRWFVLFCHEGDWHLFSQNRSALSRLSLS